MPRQAQHFQLGQFGKGLITGLIFGLLLSSILAWIIGSRPISKEKHTSTPSVDCQACLASMSNLPRQFDFYNRDSRDPITPPSPTDTPSMKPENPPGSPFFLRTKTYNKLADVELIKAELALNGFEPKMLVNKGQFQLQIGPYESRTLAEKMRADLGSQAHNFSVQ